MDDHIAFALHMTGPEKGERITDEREIARALHEERPAWLHLSTDHPDTPAWIDRNLSYLDPAIRAALTEPETRPRSLRLGSGFLVILRGINYNEGADPEDMVSLRMYIDPYRIVSLSRQPLRSVDTLVERIVAGAGPDRAGLFLADLVELLTDRIEMQVADLDRRADLLEADVIGAPRDELGSEIADQRLELTDLKRFLGPQRDAVGGILRVSDADWLTPGDMARLTEQHDQLIRVVEALEAMRETLTTFRGEIDRARDERLNRNLYVLSVISAVFLPLGFLTGLMGINLAGMPGAEWPPAFWAFTLGLAGISGGVLVILKWMRVL